MGGRLRTPTGRTSAHGPKQRSGSGFTLYLLNGARGTFSLARLPREPEGGEAVLARPEPEEV